MTNINHKALAVIGMHRSGTSCLTGILSKLGFYSGVKSNQFSPDEFNQTGYFEDKSIVDCNEHILAREFRVFESQSNKDIEIYKAIVNNLGYKQGWIYGAWVSQQRTTLKNVDLLIRNALSKFLVDKKKDDILLIKDPRLSLNLHRWADFIDFKAVLIIVRDPEYVAQSLYRRDGLSPKLSSDLYCLYNYLAFKAVKNIPHLYIDYAKLISEPSKEVERILTFLNQHGITVKHPEIGVHNFVDSKLSHKKNELIKLDDEIHEIYNTLKAGKGLGVNNGYYSINNINKRLTDALIEIRFRNQHVKLQNLHDQLKRINLHPVFRYLLKIFRFLKNDPTFGADLDV